MKPLFSYSVKALIIFTAFITASMGFSINNGILSVENLKGSSARVEFINLQGRRISQQVISDTKVGIDIKSVLVQNGRAPLVIRLTVNGKTINTIATLVANDKITFKGDLPFQAAAPQHSPSINKSASLDNNFAGVNGVVREGTLDGNPIVFIDYGDKWIYDGDILITPSSDESNTLDKTKGAGRTKSGSKWSNRTVPYVIDGGLSGRKQRITDAIAIYNRLGFTWVARTTQSNYVRFIRDTSGTYSQVGKVGGRQDIGLADWANAGDCFHEMGHTYGLWHEQSRTDRGTYVKYYSANVEAGKLNNFQTYIEQGKDGFNCRNFDWVSIMLYGSYAFSSNGKATLTRKTDGGTWSKQTDGPSAGDIVTLNTMYPQNYIVNTDVASLSGSRLDVFRVNGSGQVQTAAWDQNVSNGAWRGWWNIQNGVTAPGGFVTGLTRASRQFDVFTVGTDKRVYTAAWNQYVANGAWQGWWVIPGITLDKTAKITPIAREATKLDVFGVDTTGFVYTAAWDQYVSNGAWRGWWKIGNQRVACGAKIEAISRDANRLELFTVGDNGNLFYTLWTQAQVTWSNWTDMGNPGQRLTSVTAVKSASNRIHVFGVTLDGRIYSREWSSTVTPNWTGWKRVCSGIAAQGCKVVATSRATGYVDAFVIGSNLNIYTCAWQSNVDARNTYRGWWNIGSGITQGTQLSCAGRNSGALDVFAISGNGGAVWTRGWTSSAGWTAWTMLP